MPDLETISAETIAAMQPATETPAEAPVVTPAAAPVATPAVVTSPVVTPVVPTTPAAAPAKARDMTGIPPERHEMLRRMSQDAFDYFSGLERDKAAGKLLPAEKIDEKVAAAQFTDHPKGFILTKEFETAATKLQEVSQITANYQDALIAAEEGKNFRILTRDSKGNLVLSEEKAPSPKNKVLLRNMYADSQQSESRLTAKLEQIEADHAKSQANRDTDLATLESSLFGSIADKPVFKEAFKLGMDQIPKRFHGTKLGIIAGNALGINALLMQQLDALNAKVNAGASMAGATPAAVVGDTKLGPEETMRLAALKANAELLGMSDAND